jgi:hypothetical protein
MLIPDRYPGLFGSTGAALSDAGWIAQANGALPPDLSALNAWFVAGSRADEFLQLRYCPGPEYFNFVSLSSGCVAQMLGQAAVYCGTFVTSYGCPALTLTADYLDAGIGSTFVATAGLLAVTSGSAVISAELINEREWMIATPCVVVQLIEDVSQYS